MKADDPRMIVAGHICLDIIPSIPPGAGGLRDLMVPGKLVDVGTAVTATGGAVPNTGGALKRLGMNVRLMGKVGDDPFGALVLDILRSEDRSLAEGMIVSASDPTSYSVVINPPGVDRIFLHCPGANNTFMADNIDYRQVAGAALFHFGYPPLMRSMFADAGRELVEIFRRVKDLGVTTSLDMALPDPNSPAGKADWPAILRNVLPYVDLFLPSLDEIMFMLGETRTGALTSAASAVSRRLLDMGIAMAVIKLGDQGACLETTGDAGRLAALGPCAPADIAAWRAVSLHSPCFEVNVAGTTGAGDCTIAGFLAGLVKGCGPDDALTAAVAAGGCSVEAPSATGGMVPWDAMQTRINSGWRKRPVA